MRYMEPLVLTIVITLTGCTNRTIQIPTANGPAVYKSTRFGAKETLGGISFKSGANELKIDSVKSDLVTGFEAALQAFQAGAASAAPMAALMTPQDAALVARGMPRPVVTTTETTTKTSTTGGDPVLRAKGLVK